MSSLKKSPFIFLINALKGADWFKYVPKNRSIFRSFAITAPPCIERLTKINNGTGKILTINIKIEIVGLLKKPKNLSRLEVELPDNSTMEDLLLKLEYSRDHCRYILPIINGVRGDMHAVLSNDDEVVLTLPVGGG